jgi:hypothetical protein
MSARGKCFACGFERQYSTIEEISLHQGPRFHHWRKQMAASVGATLPEDDRLTA